MKYKKADRPIIVWVVSIIAVIFGLITIKAGGAVLFVDGVGREEAGNYVPFILWFNFLAGFIYILVGIGLFMQKHWAVGGSIFIAAATLVVFMIFGLYIFNDGMYEDRTVAAMSLRSVVWVLISIFSYWKIISKSK